MADNYIDLPSIGDGHWRAPVALTSGLPLNGNQLGDVRLAEDTNTIYVWNGSSWVAVATPGAAIAIDGLIGDVSASGPGVVSSVVNTVGGSSAVAINTSTVLVNTAQSGNKFLASPSNGSSAAPAFRAITSSDIPLTNTHLFVGNGSNVAADVALSGDATLANTGALTLVNTTVTPASYTFANITVDSKGRITTASSGTPVTSVGLVDSTNIFNVTGSPVTASGNLTLSSLKNQNANGVLVGPISGSAAAPTFRSLTFSDTPRINPASTTTIFELFDDMFLYSNTSSVGPLEMFYTANGNASFSRIVPINNNQIGILGFNAGTVNTGNATASSSIVSLLLGGITITHSTYCQLAGVGVPTSTNNYLTKFGLLNTFPGAQNGVYFTSDRSLSTTNWQAVTVKASASTVTDTGIPLDTNWHSFRIEINQAATSAGFYIDGNLVATNTTNIPTVAGQEIGPMVSVQCTGASVVVQGGLNVDWVYFKYQLGSNRGVY